MTAQPVAPVRADLNRRGAIDRQVVLALTSIVIICASLVSIFFFLRGRRPIGSQAPAIGVGEVVADETIRLIGRQGKIVIWSGDIDPSALTLATLTETLRKNSAISIVSTEPIGGHFNVWLDSESLPTERFFDLMKKHADVDAIISFAGIPVLRPEQIAQLDSRRPKLILVFSSQDLPDRMLFERGVVQLAIVPRYESLRRTGVKPATPREWFDREYQVVTAETAASLPEP